MLNLAGPEYDFGHVLYAVLEECEHVRRSLDPDPAVAGEGLRAAAAAKLAEIECAYKECGGTAPYWSELNHEVLDTAFPQYLEAALEKNRLERAGYDIWRRGDPLARGAFALGGLTLGGILVKLPFIPIWEDSFAFLLALVSFLYPELKRTYFDLRHTRLLNRLITLADRYQKDRQLHYVSNAELDQMLRSSPPLAHLTPATPAAVSAPTVSATAAATTPAEAPATRAHGDTAEASPEPLEPPRLPVH
jgi:hypothetical protein